MNEGDFILQTVGDLELQRRHLLMRVQELEQQLAVLNGQPEKEEADAGRTDDRSEHHMRQP